MAVFNGTILSGQTVSSAFELRSTDRSLAVAVSSTAGVLWYASFALSPAGPFLRFPDPWSGITSQALVASAIGGWGVLENVPTTSVRLETNAAVTATTSFALIEITVR